MIVSVNPATGEELARYPLPRASHSHVPVGRRAGPRLGRSHVVYCASLRHSTGTAGQA